MRFLEIIKSKLNKEKTQKAQTEEPQQNLLDADANLEQTEGVSRKAISIILIVAILLLAAVVYAIMTHGQKTEEEKEAEATEQTLQESVINATASSITDRFATGRTVVEIPEPPEPIKEDVKPKEVKEKQNTKTETQTNLADPTNMPPNFNQVTKESQEEINRRKRIQQMRDQAFESALKSGISANVKCLEDNNLNQDVSTNQGRSERQKALDYERERLNQRLRQIRSNSGTQVLASSPASASSGMSMPQAQGSTMQANVGVVANDPYASMASSGNWELGRSLEAPINDPYLVRAGTVIPATLISGMNSDIPGQIIAQVSQNVYDTAVGNSLLIPQGTRLIGTYNSMNIGYGQERIMCAWQRLIYPDGKVLDLGSMPGTDQAGYSGFTDLVDNHWWELISSAFLMSGVTAGVAIATEDDNSSNNDNDDNSSINDEMRQALATQFGNVIAQVIQRNLNLSPTLEIRPGYKFNVMVTKDLRFSKPFEAFDYR